MALSVVVRFSKLIEPNHKGSIEKGQAMTHRSIRRRTLLGLAASIPWMGLSPPAFASAHKGLDLKSPEGSHLANVKLRGSLRDEWVWRHYWGETYAALAEGPPVPLFKFQGLIKAKWTDNGDGTYSELLYDISGNVDWETGALLDRFENPITGQMNEVMHTWDGPNLTTHSKFGPVYPWTAEKPTEPVVLPWRVVDGSVWLTERGNFERPHPLDPKEWPLASSGDKTVSMINVTLSGALSDLENTDIMSAPHNMKWTAMRSWMPWLLLGQRPGLMLTIGMGRKISGPDAIPDSMRRILDALQPNYLESDTPWSEASNSWTRYKAIRRPVGSSGKAP